MRRSLAERLSAPGVRFKALPAGSKAALVFIVLVCLAAVLAPVIAPHDPLASDIPAQAPSGDFWFGTDRGGRDVFSRLLFGARSSLVIGFGAVALAIIVGAILGSLAATTRKAISEVIMRVLDVLMAFPAIALAAVFLAVYGNSLPVIIGTISLIYIPQIARVVRANVLAQYGEDYVRAERVMGAGRFYILTKHIIRNTAAPVLVFATVMVADAIIFEASLSFLGAGVQDPAPSWGNVIASGRNLVLNGGWWATFFPGMAILLTVLSLNILAEGLTDAMVNPRLRRAPQVRDEDGADTGVSVASTGAPLAFQLGTSVAQPSVIEEHELDELNTITVAGPASTTVPDAPVVPEPEAILATQLQLLRETEVRRTDRLPQVRSVKPVLEVSNLSIRFPERYGDIPIVDDVSFMVREGETMGLVGESGCGKSITSLAILGLLPKTARISGSIKFDGRELLTGSDDVYRGLRGEQISMIYQDALSSLNPSMLIKDQLLQLTRRNGHKSPAELLELVQLDPARTLKSYPHELSGGQRQRVLIAMALSRRPRVVIADEPTTALDVTVQAQVVDLLNELREQLGFAMVFVSHDLALVASLAHRITVMYAGQVVESGRTYDLLTDPQHEYTRGLLGAVLSIESGAPRLHQIPGTVPSPREFAPGDRFAPRSQRPDADPAQRLRFVPVGDSDHFWASHLPAVSAPGGRPQPAAPDAPSNQAAAQGGTQ